MIIDAILKTQIMKDSVMPTLSERLVSAVDIAYNGSLHNFLTLTIFHKLLKTIKSDELTKMF